MDRELRSGYTTGTCAAAAAQAAAWLLCRGETIERCSIPTGKGLAELPVSYLGETEKGVSFAVKKDAGDDPDVTDQAMICAAVKKVERDPDPSWYASGDYPGIYIDGGKGVGRVTKPGLSCPVGKAAINPVPREMIWKAVDQVRRAGEDPGPLLVTVEIPAGEELAEKTFNPKLGIVGGLSVLGTTGIVEPMSEAALTATIRLEIHMKAVEGADYLVVTPGNYGEAFAGQLPDLDLSCEMKCSNYVGETLDLAEELGIRGILFIAHIGKFIKVSGGIMNTHSRNADARAELMAAAAFRAGADRETVRKILDTGTTEEALDVLAASGQELLEHTMEEVCGRVQFYLNQRTKGSLETGAILFSSVRGKLGETETVPELIRRINEQKARIKI